MGNAGIVRSPMHPCLECEKWQRSQDVGQAMYHQSGPLE